MNAQNQEGLKREQLSVKTLDGSLSFCSYFFLTFLTL